MVRPRQKDKLHSTGRHVVKVKIGTNIDGTPIRKAFYSTKSKADAQKKADEYKKQLAISEITGQPFYNSNIGFTDYAIKYLELMKGKIKDTTYNLKYKNTFENHLMKYFKNVPITAIKKNDIEIYLKSKSNLSGETLKIHLQRLNGLFENTIENDIGVKKQCKMLFLNNNLFYIHKVHISMEQL